MGLRIIQRVREEYGGDADAHIVEKINPFTNPSRAKKALHETGRGSTIKRGPFSNGNEEDIGGGFLANEDNTDRGDFSPEERDAVEVRHTASELAIEGEKGPVDSDPLDDCPSADSDGKNRGPLKNDDYQGALIGPDLKGKAIASPKASTNGRKAAATMTGPRGNLPIDSPRRRAAPKRKTARQSEIKSQLLQQEDDEVYDSDGEVSKSKEAAFEQSAKRERNKNGSNPSARARKRG